MALGLSMVSTPTPNPSPIKREGLHRYLATYVYSPSLILGEGAGGWGP